jgi:tripartite-type tricarboxylate transporter receptor subunit TctC
VPLGTRSVIAALVAFATLVAAPLARAQAWPAKPVRLVVPYTAGGPADILARAMAQKMGETWGQQVLVENRPGANEIIAAEAVAKAPGDGYTWLLSSDAVFVLNQNLYSKLPYDPVKDLVPVSKVVTTNMILIAKPEVPFNSVREFIDHARRNPGKLSYGSVGAGGVNHLAMAWFASIHNLQMEHVAYKGLVQSLQDMVAGRLDVMFAVPGGAAPFINSGKLKAFAVSGRNRLSIAKDVPTFAEVGYPDFDASFYFGIAAPAGTPRDVVGRFAGEASKIINAAEFKEKYLTPLGFEAVGDTPEQFAAFLRTDREMAAKKVKASGAKLD